MTEPSFSINFTARMIASEACERGDLLVYDSADGYWKVATSANRTAADAGAGAIALSDYGGSVVGKVAYKDTGWLPAALTGLEDGDRAFVRTSTTGAIERIVGSPAVDDDVVGIAETDGSVHLFFGLQVSGLSGALPAGSSTEFQYRSSGTAFGAMEGLRREANGRTHFDYMMVAGDPALDFADAGATGTITRAFGSWTTDGFTTSHLPTVRGATNSANNVTRTQATSVTSTVLTLNDPNFVTESASSGAVRVWWESYLSVGRPAGTYPDRGFLRSGKLASQEGDHVLISWLNSADQTIHAFSHDANALGLGGTWDQSNQSAGVTEKPSAIGMWSSSFRQFSDAKSWERDAGGSVVYEHMTRSQLINNSASPVDMGLGATSTRWSGSLSNSAFSAVFVRSSRSTTDARYIYTNGRLAYVEEEGGASTWTTDGTNFTGDAGGNIQTDAMRIEPILPYYWSYVGGVLKIHHPGGGEVTVPDATFTIPTSSAASEGNATEVQVTDGSGGFDAATNVKAGSGFLSIGANPSTTGAARLANNVGVYSRNAANNGDLRLLIMDGSNVLRLGDNNTPIIHHWGPGTEYSVYNGTTYQIKVDNDKCGLGSPVGGINEASQPFRWKQASITKNDATDLTLTAAQYECVLLVVGGTPGGNFNVIGPANAFFIVVNNTANTLSIKDSGGVAITIAANRTATVFHDGTEYRRLTADAVLT